MIRISTRFAEGNFDKWSDKNLSTLNPFRVGGISQGASFTCNAGPTQINGYLGLTLFDVKTVSLGGTFRFNYSYYHAIFDPPTDVYITEIWDSEIGTANRFHSVFSVRPDGTAVINFLKTDGSGWDTFTSAPGVIPSDGTNHAYQLTYDWGDINNGRVRLWKDDVSIIDRVYHPFDTSGVFWVRPGYNNIRIHSYRNPIDVNQPASLMTRFTEVVFDDEGIIIPSYPKYDVSNIGMDFCQSTVFPPPMVTRFDEGNWNFWTDNTDVSRPAPAPLGGLNGGPSAVCTYGGRNEIVGRIGKQLFDPQYIVFGYNVELQYSVLTSENLGSGGEILIAQVVDGMLPSDGRFFTSISVTADGRLRINFLRTNSNTLLDTFSSAPGVIPLDGSNHAIQWQGSWGDINNHHSILYLDGVKILDIIYHPADTTGIYWKRGGYNTIYIHNRRNPTSLNLNALTMTRFAEVRINYPIALYPKLTIPNITATTCSVLVPTGFGTVTVAKVIDKIYDKETPFVINAPGLDTNPFQLTMDTEKIFNRVTPGSGYSISEDPVQGYESEIHLSNDSTPSNITVNNGENVTVLIINKRIKRPYSGLYYIQKDKRHDTLIKEFFAQEFEEVPLPNPFIDTSLIGDE